jgi:UDP-GlcNAc:undecaprenyl-phosphate/decaprenyl-phosphate GlcNAc-1-phosphate transferase
VGIFFGILFSLCALYIQTPNSAQLGLLLLISGMPAFLIGLFEDLTKSISARIRLIVIMASAYLSGFLNNSWILSLGIPGMDLLMSIFPAFAIFFTCFSVCGVANAFNLIDGYNGLSSMVAVFILLGIAYVAFNINDHTILLLSFSMIGGIMGFLVWNYPNGHIFWAMADLTLLYFGFLR